MRLLSRFLCFGLVLASASAGVTAAEPALGVYHWPNGTAGVDAFAAWLHRPAAWGVDFIGGESWDNVEWPTWWLEHWGKWTAARPGRRLILSVPILAGPVDGSGPVEGHTEVRQPVTLEKGAAGDLNHHFRQLAENLVKYHLPDSILRLGWEFNGDWYAWRAQEKPEAFAEFWRQIVKTMRAVPGAEHLQFCWNPTLGDQKFPAEQAWPGDEYVDYVGVDVYDEVWNPETYPWPTDASAVEIDRRHRKVWEEWIMYSARGLRFWNEFAQAHHKPLSIPEWGLNHRSDGHGGMDNPYFIEQMHAFVTDPANNVAFQCYFDINADDNDHRHQISPGVVGTGKKEGTEYPKSAARFRALFSASGK